QATAHPLLGARLPLAGTDVVYETLFTRAHPAWLDDHRVGDGAIVPGAALVQLLRPAREETFAGDADVTQMVFQTPLAIPAPGGVQFGREGDRAAVNVASKPADASSGEWIVHASAEIATVGAAPLQTLDLSTLRARCASVVDVEALHADLASSGLAYGPAFRG